MIYYYYFFVGLVYSLVHNYDLFINEKESMFYKIWSMVLIAIFFPISILIKTIYTIEFFLKKVEK